MDRATKIQFAEQNMRLCRRSMRTSIESLNYLADLVRTQEHMGNHQVALGILRVILFHVKSICDNERRFNDVKAELDQLYDDEENGVPEEKPSGTVLTQEEWDESLQKMNLEREVEEQKQKEAYLEKVRGFVFHECSTCEDAEILCSLADRAITHVKDGKRSDVLATLEELEFHLWNLRYNHRRLDPEHTIPSDLYLDVDHEDFKSSEEKAAIAVAALLHL